MAWALLATGLPSNLTWIQEDFWNPRGSPVYGMLSMWCPSCIPLVPETPASSVSSSGPAGFNLEICCLGTTTDPCLPGHYNVVLPPPHPQLRGWDLTHADQNVLVLYRQCPFWLVSFSFWLLGAHAILVANYFQDHPSQRPWKKELTKYFLNE